MSVRKNLKTKKVKAIVLLSGGLDSALALKLVQQQGIDAIAVNFLSPFCTCDQKGRCFSREIAQKSGVPYKVVSKGKAYLKVVRKPKYGYGKGMNPCIDCRIYMLKKTRKLLTELGAKFVVTGEVLGQRPMSQHRKALSIIEKDAGLEGKILRPLSGKLFPITEPEKKGWIDRKKLLAVQGRSRKPQFDLARKLKVEEFACPAGGCLLTLKEFANKLKDLFEHKKKVTTNDVLLLKIGRHFRFGKNKIIVGRNEKENSILAKRKQKTDYIFEVPGWGSPISILQGKKNIEAIEFTARLTAMYSDCKDEKVRVKYGSKNPLKTIIVKPSSKVDSNRHNLTLQMKGSVAQDF
jgi:tRNA U34 2-thiouridine synthase MnmA/TrmU